MCKVPQYLQRVGDGIPPQRNGHAIALGARSDGGLHGDKQKIVGTRSKQLKRYFGYR